MKVIKKGRKQEGWAKEFKCSGVGNGGGGCEAVLLVEVGDLFSTMRCCRDEVDYFVTFRCSECGVLTDIEDGPPIEVLPSQEAWEKDHG